MNSSDSSLAAESGLIQSKSSWASWAGAVSRCAVSRGAVGECLYFEVGEDVSEGRVGGDCHIGVFIFVVMGR